MDRGAKMDKKVVLQITILILFVSQVIGMFFLDGPLPILGLLAGGALGSLVCFYIITKHSQ
jgi:hypothetical protein